MQPLHFDQIHESRDIFIMLFIEVQELSLKRVEQLIVIAIIIKISIDYS